MAKTKREFENEIAGSPAVEQPLVLVRVTKAGDGMISTGEHRAVGGDVMYERNEEFVVARDIAQSLEDRHFAEIQDEPAPKK